MFIHARTPSHPICFCSFIFSDVGIDECAYKYLANTWGKNPTERPLVEHHDVYHHLIMSPSVFSNEAMENYKSFKADKFFLSGWVQTVKHMALPSGLRIKS